MPEEIVDVIEAQEFKVPAVSTGSQAFLLIVAGFQFFFTNYKKTTIFLLIALFVFALVLYNNVNLIKEVYSLTGQGE